MIGEQQITAVLRREFYIHIIYIYITEYNLVSRAIFQMDIKNK